MCHFLVAYIDLLLCRVLYMNLHTPAKHLILNCMVRGCSTGPATVLKCVFINSSQGSEMDLDLL